MIYGTIIGIIGGISRVYRGQSTQAQRVWTMTWLAVELSFCYTFLIFGYLLRLLIRPIHSTLWFTLIFCCLLTVSAFSRFIFIGHAVGIRIMYTVVLIS